MAKDNISYNKTPLDDDFINRLMKEELSESDKLIFSEQTDNKDLWGDAIEGLESYTSFEKARKQSYELNTKLGEQLKTKKDYKNKPIINTTAIVWTAIIVVILLVFLAFHLIRLKG